ncbi:MAG TPA: hypothetical protein VNW92_15570 [Polyangiaceae bacterium]|jgi:hypothetical protein|nr:hypothetical protein [Polyangiaceae bacterium]
MQIKPLSVLIGLCIGALAACSSPSSPPITSFSGAGMTGSSAGTGNSAAGSAGTSSASAGTGGQSTGAGGSGGGGMPGTAGSGAAGSTGVAGGAGSSGQSTMSAGCGKPLPALVVPGTFAELASQPMPNGSPGFSSAPSMMVPCNPADDTADSYPPCVGGMKKRGFFVYVKTGFDNTKPSKVIYEAAGCDESSAAQGGKAGYQYQSVDSASPVQVIQVGLEYSRKNQCYDNTNPKSNDFPFFDMLHKYIEDNFCVDETKEYWSGYSSGAWVGNQMTCAFPDVLHAMLAATGSEPAMQPPCVSGHPVAGLFLHDKLDAYNTYDSMLPGCTRLLKQNGCTTTTCDPSSTATTTGVNVPAGLGTPQSMTCVQFNGCPANGQVTWCTTQLNTGDMQAHYIGQDSWITKFFWDFMSKY